MNGRAQAVATGRTQGTGQLDHGGVRREPKRHRISVTYAGTNCSPSALAAATR